ncbi:MAG: DEAD/DEAH box helicase, partial [Chloroflexota bacterium]
MASLLETQPLLSQAKLDLARWLSDYYFTPLFDCAALFMPPGFRQRVRTAVALVPPRPGAAATLSDRQRQLLEYVGLTQAPRDMTELAARFGRRIESQVRSLIKAGLLLQVSQFERPRTGPKFVRRIAPTALGLAADIATPQWSRRFRQRTVLEALRLTPDGVELSDLRSRAPGITAPILESLEEEGLIRTWEERVVRDPLAHRSFQEGFAPPLTADQAEAVRQITASLVHSSPAKEPFLLHGITGSGKTEVYLQALKECVARGKRGIVLVPEIALEPQTVARFSARFPGRVAVLHSGLTPGEAYDEWWRIRAGEFDVVVGPRSALFAPQPDLGLIVIDEEHEPTYKQQDPPPRYHARAVALQMARTSGPVLVLGSATPDVESYVNGLQHRLRILELPDRPTSGGVAHAGRDRRGLPSVVVADL